MFADSLSGNLTATISDEVPQFLIVPNIFSNPLPTSAIFMREIGLALIKKIFFLITTHQNKIEEEQKAEEQNIDYSIEICLSKINELLDNFAPFKKINKYKLKFNSKPWITPGLQRSVSVKNKFLSDFIKKKKKKDPTIKAELS